MVLIKKLENFKGLEKRTKYSSGYDILSPVCALLLPSERILIPCGFTLDFVSKDTFQLECQIRPKSGLSIKYGITVLNSPGTIDADYTGEVGVILINHGKDRFFIEEGMAIAQLVISSIPPVSVVDELGNGFIKDNTRFGGFGSTGR
jgi:dUTP pyrophosphatase